MAASICSPPTLLASAAPRPHAPTTDFYHVPRTQVPETLQLPGLPPLKEPKRQQHDVTPESQFCADEQRRRAAVDCFASGGAHSPFSLDSCASNKPFPQLFFAAALTSSPSDPHSLRPLLWHERGSEGKDRRVVRLHNRSGPAAAAHRLRVCLLLQRCRHTQPLTSWCSDT